MEINKLSRSFFIELRFLPNRKKLVFTFQDNLEALGKSRRRLYDDGRAFVLDLQARGAR